MLNKLRSININIDKWYPMTQLLILINIVVFILQTLYPIVTELGVFRSDVLYSYITSMFMHGGLGHILMNMLIFSFIAPVVEKHYGSLFLLIAYLFTGFIGNIGSALFNPSIMGLGASGAICGINMLWVFHQVINKRFILIFPAIMYFIIQGLSAGLDLMIPSGVGHLVHFVSAISAIFLIPLMFVKRK